GPDRDRIAAVPEASFDFRQDALGEVTGSGVLAPYSDLELCAVLVLDLLHDEHTERAVVVEHVEGHAAADEVIHAVQAIGRVPLRVADHRQERGAGLGQTEAAEPDHLCFANSNTTKASKTSTSGFFVSWDSPSD